MTLRCLYKTCQSPGHISVVIFKGQQFARRHNACSGQIPVCYQFRMMAVPVLWSELANVARSVFFSRDVYRSVACHFNPCYVVVNCPNAKFQSALYGTQAAYNNQIRRKNLWLVRPRKSIYKIVLNHITQPETTDFVIGNIWSESRCLTSPINRTVTFTPSFLSIFLSFLFYPSPSWF